MKRNNLPSYIREALKVLKPPERLTVSEWADKYRVLDSKTSNIPGRWSTEQTPYLRAIMDAFTDPEVEEFAFVKPTQVGGTEALNNMIGYVIAQDPAAALVVYPTLELAEFTAENRVKPMINLCRQLAERFDPASKRLELQFDGMYLVLSGANSESSLASRPCRYLFLDEVDKYPDNAGKEADPISLARERTKTYAYNKKIFMTSTPTLKTNNIWQAWENAETQYQYFVPCPFCGKFHIMVFKNIEFDKKGTPDEARQSAVYKCPECQKVISDLHKTNMVKAGEWRPVRRGKSRRKIAFHLNAIYSPWVRFGDVAAEWVESHKNPLKLMNFINSWLAEPWEDVENSVTAAQVLEKESKYEKYEIPENTVLLTAGADVQKKCIYYTVRAWLNDMTNYNAVHGKVDSFRELEIVMNQEFYTATGEKYLIDLCCLDSGDQTDDVYEFCYYNSEWCVPVKGSSTKIYSKYNMSKIDKENSLANGMKLIIIDTDFYKDMIAARVHRKTENGGGFFVYADCDAEYAEQIASEHKVVEKNKSGKIIERWKPKKSNVDNHYLDCEVYAYCAADICGIRAIDAERHNQSEQLQEEPQEEKTNPWIKKISLNNGSWLKR